MINYLVVKRGCRFNSSSSVTTSSYSVDLASIPGILFERQDGIHPEWDALEHLGQFNVANLFIYS